MIPPRSERPEQRDHVEEPAGFQGGDGGEGRCPVCDGHPRVLVAIRHELMRRFTCDLLDREYGCWTAAEPAGGERLGESLRRVAPDLLVIDAGDFPECCRAALAAYPRERVVVIGPEPDRAYEAAAFSNGAGAWIPRDRIGDDLGGALRRLLGCRHDPCPSAAHRSAREPDRGSIEGAVHG